MRTRRTGNPPPRLKTGVDFRTLLMCTGALEAGLGLFVICALPCAAAAQSVDAKTVGKVKQGGPDKLEQIVVTAERRGVTAQKTPISVIVLSGRALAQRGITDINTLQQQAPSLSYVDNGNTQYINIRGVGLDESSPNQTNGVAVNYDGAYVAREFNNRDPFFDLRDVEVLRGPQGTYQGQNAEGGAVFINSAPPVLGRYTGFAETSYGSFNHYTYDGAINVPVTPDFSLRASLWDEARDSYFTNNGPFGKSTNSNHPGDLRRVFARVQALYKPSEDFSFRLIEQHSEYKSDGPAFKSNNAPAGQKPYDVDYDLPGLLDTSYNRVTGIVDWNATDLFRIHSTLAYQNTKQEVNQDTDYTSPFLQPGVPQAGNGIRLKDYYYTGEIDFISTTPGPFSWTAGATFLQYDQKGFVHPTSYNTPADPSLINDNSKGLVIFIEAPRQDQAVFAEVGYKILPDLELKVGGRYNHDLLGFSPNTQLQPLGPNTDFVIPLHPGYPQFKTFTGRALLNWTPTKNDLFYATISRGYKPGGTTPFADYYSPEYVLNYEAGWKGSLLGNLLRPSISAFYMQYKNYQATVATDPNNPTLDITDNVQGTTVRGIEAQLDGRVGPWGLDGSMSYLDSRYGGLGILEPAGAQGGGQPAAATQINLGGRQIDYAPKFSASIGGSYTTDLPVGSLNASLRLNYQTRQYTYFYDLGYDRIPSHATVNMRIAYDYNAHWRAEVYGSNIFNRTYIANTVQSTDGVGEYLLGAPAEFGVKLAYAF